MLHMTEQGKVSSYLAAKMNSFTAYPDDKQVSMVAEALVTKHPCLKELGSQTGWYGWKNSLKFKMVNFRTKLCHAGFHEVAVNSGKRSRNNPDKQSPHTNIKRPKRAEVNFLPNFPRGEDAASLERLRLQIVNDVKMTDKNLPLIGKLMQTTGLYTFFKVKFKHFSSTSRVIYTIFQHLISGVKYISTGIYILMIIYLFFLLCITIMYIVLCCKHLK